MITPKIVVFDTINELAERCLVWLREQTTGSNTVSIALSGGRTPQSVFDLLSTKDWSDIDVSKFQLYWVDERCVPPTSDESNFGIASRLLFEKIQLPDSNIFRMIGENNPEFEAKRYSQLLGENLTVNSDFPCFDLILLGMGNDGHTASIFPGNEHLFDSKAWCAVAKHPETGQNRITLTGSLINHAKNIVFLVTGSDKASLVDEIIHNTYPEKYPSSYIKPTNGSLIWVLDKDSAAAIH